MDIFSYLIRVYCNIYIVLIDLINLKIPIVKLTSNLLIKIVKIQRNKTKKKSTRQESNSRVKGPVVYRGLMADV